jgi:predicted anti-sigma-YlaC factor YlaD
MRERTVSLRSPRERLLPLAAAILVVLGGCQTVRHFAVDRVADSLADGGAVFTGDADPQLVLDALPFGLKTYESLLADAPKHRGLLLASARGFTAYAFLLQRNADLDATLTYADRRALDKRIAALFVRGRDYALRGLALDDPDVAAELASNRPLTRTPRTDVAFLYWAGTAWAAAIASAKDDPGLLVELPSATTLMRRALELDEAYDAGAIHEFFVTYEGSRPGGDLDAAQRHYERALELSRGARASLYLALAEGVCVQRQNVAEFRTLIQRALAVDPNGVADWRLVNTVAQRRAVWLQSRIPDWFIDEEK